MGESLMEQRRVCDEGFRLVKHCCKRRMTLRVTVQCVTVSYQKGTAKYVPAAAVIRTLTFDAFEQLMRDLAPYAELSGRTFEAR